MDQVKNFAKGTVSGPYESTDTAIDLQTGHAARFPTPPFNAVWWNASDYPDPADDPTKEIVRVTNISTDTLTITRAQEGTTAEDHNTAGKTYNLIAGLTALAWSTLLGDVFGSGTAILISIDSETIELRQSATKGVAIASGSTTIEDTTSVDIGDPIGNNNSSFMSISDQNQRVSFIGLDIATDRTASASGPVGSVVAKLALRDGSGTIIGYVPIYGSIT